jgi:hypothetical protein
MTLKSALGTIGEDHGLTVTHIELARSWYRVAFMRQCMKKDIALPMRL